MSYGKKPKSENKSKGRPALKPRSSRQSRLIYCRSSFGSTEKILRRNAQTWRRKFAKEGRQIDKAEVQAGLSATAELPIGVLKLPEDSPALRDLYVRYYKVEP